MQVSLSRLPGDITTVRLYEYFAMNETRYLYVNYYNYQSAIRILLLRGEWFLIPFWKDLSFFLLLEKAELLPLWDW